MVDVDEAEIVHVLQQKMAGVVKDIATRMIVRESKEALECRAVVQILRRVQLKAKVDAGRIECIEHRPPAARQFTKAFVYQIRPAPADRDRNRARAANR